MNLKAKIRDLSVNPDTIRKEDGIPAELYGHGFSNVHLSVSAKEFNQVFKEAGESTVIKLDIEGIDDKDVNVLVHEISKNPLSDEFKHIDFYRLRMDEKVKTGVPLVFEGEAPAVKEKLGLLVKAVQELEVEALPADLPHEIKVDLSGLTTLGASISVNDLVLPKGVKVLADGNTVLAAITEIVEEKVEEAPAPEGAEAESAEGAGSVASAEAESEKTE